MTDVFGMPVRANVSFDTDQDSSEHEPRIFLPIVLAIMAIRGSLLPWVTVREFNGEKHEYNLLDVKGGTSILMTIAVLSVIGMTIAIFKRITGLTVASLAIASLGWMAAISGALLGILGSLLPSINVAGIDLTRASVGQGSGVTITIVSSFALAFMIVRRLTPVDKYSPRAHISVLPLVALIPLILIAINMHSEWMVLGSAESNYQAIIAGDSLYGSGLLVLVLWLNVGLWIAAVIVQRSIVAKFAGTASILVSLVVTMYTVFLWGGGKALAWLIPSNVEKWATVTVNPVTFLVGFASISLLVLGGLSFLPSVTGRRLGIAERRKVGNTRLHSSDLAAAVLMVCIAVSIVYEILTQ